MKKDITIYFYYNNSKNSLSKRYVKAPPTYRIQNLRISLLTTTSEFTTPDLIFVSSNKILKDDVNFGTLAQKSETSMVVFPKIIPITVQITESNSETFNIDITNPIKQIIKEILSFLTKSDNPNYELFRNSVSSPWRYALLYENKQYPLNKNVSTTNAPKNNICCSSLPLYAHDWWYSEFKLIRRLCIDDETFLNRYDIDRQFFFDCCKFSTKSGMSLFKTEDWILLCSYILLSKSENPNAFDQNFVIQNCESILPPDFDMDPNFVSKILSTLKASPELSPKEYEITYISQSLKTGSHFSFCEPIKLEYRIFSQKRILYVSSFNLILFNDSTKTIDSIKNIDDINTIDLKGIENYFITECSEQTDPDLMEIEIVEIKHEPLSINESERKQKYSLPSLKKLNTASETTNTDTNNNGRRIIINFSDGSSWKMKCRSPAVAARLKAYIYEMINLARKSRKSLDNDLSMSSMNLTVDEKLSLNNEGSLSNASISNESVSIGTAMDPNSDDNEKSMSKLLYIENFFKDEITIIANLNAIDKNYIVNYEGPLEEKPKTEISYANYTKIIRPKERIKAEMDGNYMFDYLKETIPENKMSDSIPIEIARSQSEREAIINKFFELSEKEKWYRNPLTVGLLLFLIYKIILLNIL